MFAIVLSRTLRCGARQCGCTTHYGVARLNRCVVRGGCRYPLGDPSLQMVFDLIGVLTAVNQMAFSTRGWHLRFENPQLQSMVPQL